MKSSKPLDGSKPRDLPRRQRDDCAGVSAELVDLARRAQRGGGQVGPLARLEDHAAHAAARARPPSMSRAGVVPQVERASPRRRAAASIAADAVALSSCGRVADDDARARPVLADERRELQPTFGAADGDRRRS